MGIGKILLPDGRGILFEGSTNDVSDSFHTFGELYEHRIQLFIALCWAYYQFYSVNDESVNPIWKSKRHYRDDDPMFDNSFIMGISTPYGDDIRYHLPISKWDECNFAKEEERAPEWDGGTNVLERLKNL